jgi:hypothetical protein
MVGDGEVASYEHPRIHGVGNLNALRDGSRVLRTILVERYQARGRKAPATNAITSDSLYDVGPEFNSAEHYLLTYLSDSHIRDDER